MTRQRRRSLIKAKRTGMGIALVATLSFIAGMTDAIGLRMSGDFVSFMTGNTTRAAMSLQDGNWGHALKLLGAIATFVLGNAVGIVIAHRADNRIFAVLAAVGATLAVASVMPTSELPLVQFYLVVLAMGMINAAVEHVEGLPIGLTYVTGALSRFVYGLCVPLDRCRHRHATGLHHHADAALTAASLQSARDNKKDAYPLKRVQPDQFLEIVTKRVPRTRTVISHWRSSVRSQYFGCILNTKTMLPKRLMKS